MTEKEKKRKEEKSLEWNWGCGECHYWPGLRYKSVCWEFRFFRQMGKCGSGAAGKRKRAPRSKGKLQTGSQSQEMPWNPRKSFHSNENPAKKR